MPPGHSVASRSIFPCHTVGEGCLLPTSPSAGQPSAKNRPAPLAVGRSPAQSSGRSGVWLLLLGPRPSCLPSCLPNSLPASLSFSVKLDHTAKTRKTLVTENQRKHTRGVFFARLMGRKDWFSPRSCIAVPGMRHVCSQVLLGEQVLR